MATNIKRFVSGLALLALLAAVAVAPGGCKGKGDAKNDEPAPHAPVVAGLAAIPATATVVIGVDVERLRSATLAARAVARLFARDPALQKRVAAITGPCKIDLGADVSAVLIAMRRLDESLLVATGAFEKVSLARCVSEAMSASGGTLATKQIGGRPAYHATGKSRGVWFARGGPRTLLVSSSETWLAAALGKAAGPRQIQPILDRVKRDAPAWVAAAVPTDIADGLVKTSGASLGHGPASLFGELRLEAGLSARVGLEMSSPEDAKLLVSLVEAQLGVVALAAQRMKLGTLVSKVKVDADAKTVYLRVSLDEADVKQLTSRIDSPKAPEQDTQSPRDATQE